MSEVVTDIEQLKEEVGSMVGPFFDKYNGLDAEIKKREKRIEEIKQEMKELRDARSYLRTIIRNINPDLIPAIHNGGPRKKTPSNGKSSHVSKETLEAIRVWIQSRKDELNNLNEGGGGFRPVDIYRSEGFPLKSESAVNKVLRDMHEAGLLHLDRWVRGLSHPGRPTGKFYKVV